MDNDNQEKIDETTETLLMHSFPLTYEKIGTGTPVILLHGFPFNRTIWQPQVKALSEMCQVITPDLRGHGKSPAPGGSYNMRLMVRDVLETLNELKIEKAIWVGHSMGGYITLEAWRRAPERFLGVGFICTHHKADSPEKVKQRYQQVTQVLEQGSEVMTGAPVFAEGTPEDTDYVKRINEIVRATSPNGIAGSLMAMASRKDSTATLKEINVSSLVLAGRKDQLITPDIAEEMASLLPASQLVFAEKSGHMPMLEEPDVVARELRNLVLRVNHSKK